MNEDINYIRNQIKARICHAHGNDYREKYQYPTAIEEYTEAINYTPNDPSLYVDRGLTYRRIGNHVKAVQDYSKAIFLDPHCVDAYNNRGSVYRMTNNLEQAHRDFVKALDLDPCSYEAYHGLGSVYYCIGAPDKAIEYFTKAISISPTRADAYYNRGTTYLMHKIDFAHAIDDYEKSVQFNKDYFEAYINLGICYGELGEKDKAYSNFMEAKRINPTSRQVKKNLDALMCDDY